MKSALAVKSDFSIGESVLTIEDIVKEVVKAGQTAAALVDTMSITGMIEFTNEAKKAGIKPIIGCRLRLVDDVTWRKTKEQKSQPEFFMNWYVLSEAGLKALFKLLSLAYSADRFYNVPKLSFDDLFEALASLSADDVALTSSDVNSVVLHDDAVNLLQKIPASLRASNCFLALSPINTPYWDSVNVRAIEIGTELDLRYIVTRYAVHPEGAADNLEVMTAISRNEKISSMWHWSCATRDLQIMVSNLKTEIHEAVRRVAYRRKMGPTVIMQAFLNGVRNTDELVDMVKYEWSKQKPSLPVMAPDEMAALVNECKKGWAVRFSKPVFGHQPSHQDLRDIYKPRLAYELSVLKTLGFASYFLLVQEIVQFAKSSNIMVGPGRGSVGGSLVAYLMGITDCDPIRFDLLFERFINPDRLDLPDADLDFMATRRHEVFDYLTNKYGADRVATISNFSRLGSSSGIRDVSRVLELPEEKYRCSKFVPKEHGQPVGLEEAAAQVAEIAEFKLDYPEIWGIAKSLEGVIRNMSQHAAGVIVAGEPLTERAVIENRGEQPIVTWDKRVVEEQGLIKIDVLGLNTLDLIRLALDYVWERHTKRIDLLDVHLDDPGILKMFAEGRTIGVFQFESGGIRRLLKDLGQDGTLTFEDIVAATALYRPGPMDSGMMASYVKRKQGLEVVEYDHESLREPLSTTYGVMVYQEQVMKAAQLVAGYTLAQADKLRKIMGKKLPEEMKKERGKFVDGCVNSGNLDAEEAGELFDKIEKFAGYGFNRSHSVEYSLISWWSMWLKVNYPIEFYAAALSIMPEAKIAAVLADADRMGIEVRMPDVNLSTDRFEIITDTQLCIPFNRVKGISTETARMIVEKRKEGGEYKSKADFEKRVERRRCNSARIRDLDLIGAFVRVEPGQPGWNSTTRIRDQKELIPGLVTGAVPIHHDMNTSKDDKIAILEVVSEYMLKHGIDPAGREDDSNDGVPVKPGFGSNAKLMVIFDQPSSSEEKAGRMGSGDGFAWQATMRALHEAEMPAKDVYWTALLKRPKEGKQITPKEISTYAPYLTREIEILKPPLIVLLGSNAIRHFIKDFKGKASEAANTIVYDKDLDANLILGFSPGEIWHDPDKQILLNEIFQTVASLST